MIIELTENEQITLLGLLEDIAKEDAVNNAFSIKQSIALSSIIQKLGGTYFGKLTKVQLSSMYGIQGGLNNGQTI